MSTFMIPVIVRRCDEFGQLRVIAQVDGKEITLAAISLNLVDTPDAENDWVAETVKLFHSLIYRKTGKPGTIVRSCDLN